MTTHDLQTQEVNIDLLRPHPRNARNGDVDAIAESLQTNGQYKPIIVAADGTILAGNHTYAAAMQLGWPTIAAVRLDLDPNSDEAVRIMVADNRTADLGTYDDALLLELIQDLPDLSGTGYDKEALEQLQFLEDAHAREALNGDWEKYTKAINIPQYEPTGERPTVREVYDDNKAQVLRDEIMEADLDDEVRSFLLAAAHRHTVFNYRLAAEFYAHADAKTQRLMERSALIILDLDDAIRDGYAVLDSALTAMREEDRDDDA